MIERVSKIFWLLDAAGGRHFPIRIRNRSTGKVQFRVSDAGNRLEDGLEIDDIEIVADLVVNEGYRVRVVAEAPPHIRGLIGLSKRKTVAYGRG